jgi:hypothetical protein
MMLGALALLTFAGTTAAPPVPMGRHRHWFVDRHLLQVRSSINVTFELHAPYVEPSRVLQADQPWEKGYLAQGWGALVAPTAPGKPIQMYYELSTKTACTNASECGDLVEYPAMALAESVDGRRWTKPRLGLIEFPASGPHTTLSTANNLVGWGVGNTTYGVCPPSVFVDPNAPPDERYKAPGKTPSGTGCRGPNGTIVRRTELPGGRGSCDYVVMASPDGKSWTPWASYAGQLGSTDSMSTIRWSALSQRYQLYMRYYGPLDSSTRGYAYEHHWWRCVRRLVSRTAALPRDGIDWVNATVFCPDALDNSTHGGGAIRTRNATTGFHGPPPVDFYGGVPFEVPGAAPGTLLMTVNQYWHVVGACASKSCSFGAPGRHTVGLVVSRNDGLSWSWVGGRKTLIPNGAEGTWNSRAIWAMGPPIWTPSGEQLLFFGGHNKAETHADMGGRTINGVIGLDPHAPDGEEMAGYGVAVSRWDGWASIGSGYATVGEVTTVPLSWSANTLTVNVACGGHGTLRVEVQNAEGMPSPCFTLARSVATWATSTNLTLAWDHSGLLGENEGGGERWGECSLAEVGSTAGGGRLRFVLEDCRLHSFAFAATARPTMAKHDDQSSCSNRFPSLGSRAEAGGLRQCLTPDGLAKVLQPSTVEWWRYTLLTLGNFVPCPVPYNTSCREDFLASSGDIRSHQRRTACVEDATGLVFGLCLRSGANCGASADGHCRRVQRRVDSRYPDDLNRSDAGRRAQIR